MNQVIVYTSDFCGYCNAAKALLKKKGIPYEEISLAGKHQQRMELARKTGQRTVPQIFVGQTHVGGYSELRALVRRGDLTPLLVAEGIAVEG